nr:hypothetical protein [Candidatus Bathyarchaeota archaeon]
MPLRRISEWLSNVKLETAVEIIDVSFATLLVLTIILFFLNVIMLPKNVFFLRIPELNVFSAYYSAQRLSFNDEAMILLSMLVAAPTPLSLFVTLRIRSECGESFSEAWEKMVNSLREKWLNKEREGIATIVLLVSSVVLIVLPFTTILLLQPVIIDYVASNLTAQWYQGNMICFASSLAIAYITSKINDLKRKAEQ